MEKTYNIVELFSGIGSQAAALKNLGVKINTVGTSEWDVHAIVAYDMIHGGTDIPADIARMSKDELLEKMSHYTFSNSERHHWNMKLCVHIQWNPCDTSIPASSEIITLSI